MDLKKSLVIFNSVESLGIKGLNWEARAPSNPWDPHSTTGYCIFQVGPHLGSNMMPRDASLSDRRFEFFEGRTIRPRTIRSRKKIKKPSLS